MKTCSCFFLFLCSRHQPGLRPQLTRREQQQKIIILFCRGSSAMILLWMSPHTSATFLPLMHGSTYTPQSGRNFFASSCGLICLSQTSFQEVKVSKKVDKKGHPGVFRSQVRHLSSLGANRMEIMTNSGQLLLPLWMHSNGIPAIPEEKGWFGISRATGVQDTV